MGAAFQVTPDVARYDEALEFFSKRVVMTAIDARKLDDATKTHAFWVGGGLQLEQVQRVFDKLGAAIERGDSFDDFKKAVLPELRNAAHVETVFRNATQRSYNAGRWAQMREESTAKFRPYWLFDALLDPRTTDICKLCDGTLLLHDHPWWKTHVPPLHHRCFPAGTLIQTDGGLVPIEDLHRGDMVLTHLGRYRRITDVMQSPSPDRLVQVRCMSGANIVGTETHPALTQRGWIELAALRSGDRLIKLGEITAQHSAVRNAHRNNSRGNDRAHALDAESFDGLRDLERDVALGQVEVDEQELFSHLHGVLEHGTSSGLCQPVEQGLFCCGGLGARLRMRARVSAMQALSGVRSALDRTTSLQSTALAELLRDALESGMRGFGLATGPVFAHGCSSAHHSRELLNSARSAPLGLTSPLIGNCLGASSNGDAVLLEQFPKRRQSIDAERIHGFSNRKLLRDVKVAQDFRQSLAVLLEKPVLEGGLEVVAGHEWIRSSGDTVFNIAVADDESYVASGIVVHNCRSSVRNMRRSEAQKRGITLVPPGDDGTAQPGWGQDPTDDPPPWRPSASKYDTQLLLNFEGRAAVGTKSRKKRTVAKPKDKPQLDTARWVPIYENIYGAEAAASLAHGKAALEHGLDLPVKEVRKQLRKLKSPGTAAMLEACEDCDAARTLREQAGEKDPLRKAAAALAGHLRTLPKRDKLKNRSLSLKPEGRAALEYFTAITGPNAGNIPEALKAISIKKAAGSYFEPGLVVYTRRVGALHHELAHALEHYSQLDMIKRVRAFLRERAKGYPIVRMAGKNGLAWKDEFYQVYTGKRYPLLLDPPGPLNHDAPLQATEVLSTGVELLFANETFWGTLEDWVAFDPEHFYFVLGQLAGK